MRNPFNPDHDHEFDRYPEFHLAVLNLRLHWIKSEGEEKQRASDALDHLINACPNYECAECAAICCPHKDEMHFHHDGCPSCAEPLSPDYPVTSTPDPQADQPSRA